MDEKGTFIRHSLKVLNTTILKKLWRNYEDFDELINNLPRLNWIKLNSWDCMKDKEILYELNSLRSFEGNLFVVTDYISLEKNQVFEVKSENIYKFSEEYFNEFKEAMIDGDTVIVSSTNKIWLFHHEGVYTFFEFNKLYEEKTQIENLEKLVVDKNNKKISAVSARLWKSIYKRLDECDKEVIYLLNKSDNANKVLDILQVKSQSFLGSIIINTSGVIIDNWIRLLGCDCEGNRGIVSYNLINEERVPTRIEKMLIVADDIIGGIFALNKGKFPSGLEKVWYFNPYTLNWESLEMDYSTFLHWISDEKMDEFYSKIRWSNWKEDAKIVRFNEAIFINKFLWTKEIQFEKLYNKILPVEELLYITQEYRKKTNYI